MRFMKNKKQEIKPEPRPVEEITKEYTGVASQLGAIQYQVLVLQQKADSLVKKMHALNSEGEHRNKLDTEAKLKEDTNGKK